MRIRNLLVGSIAALTALTVFSLPASAGGPREWAFHVGSFNATKTPSAAEAGVEARWETRWPGLDAVAGVTGAEDGNFWVYAGARYPLALDENWAFTPGFAVSLYEEGDGKDLGGLVEFRSSFEISVKTGKRSRLGFSFYHLSNAGIYDKNPGSNSAVLVWSVVTRDPGDGE